LSNKIVEIISLKNQEVIDYLSKYEEISKEINYFNNILDLLNDRSKIEINLSLVRGLGYYTGMIYEALLKNQELDLYPEEEDMIIC